MRVLGISAYYHDSAAALIEDGKILAAAQEERFTRKKHDAAFPAEAVGFCLKQAGLHLTDIDWVVFYEKPLLKFERLLQTYFAYAPRGFSSFRKAIPVWIKESLFQKKILIRELQSIDPSFERSRLIFSEHHLSHAASAFFPSPFESAIVLTLDGVGEWTTASLALGKGSHIETLQEIRFPHSLGLLYSAFTYYTGFKVNSGEYKLMGLAPYGKPIYADLIRTHLIDLKPDGSFHLDLSYFNYCTGLRMTSAKFDRLFGGAPRKAEAPVTQREMDLAASIQVVLEEVVVAQVKHAVSTTGVRNLCLAGGVALNCVANGRLWREKIVDRIWIQPAAGDSGGALGAAFAGLYLHAGLPRTIETTDSMKGSYLGPSFEQEETVAALEKAGAVFHVVDENTLLDRVVDSLVAEKAVGWVQGRMEFGPRALGGRSILGDPRSPSMQKLLNLKVKFRESFRPFAPSVIAEDLAEWFDLDTDSPYMLLVAPVAAKHCYPLTEEQKQLTGLEKLAVRRSPIPAVTHVDYSARVQTVHSETNPLYHRLLERFKAKTGCSVLVNTSFNVRGEPIVCSPSDAYRCFMGSEIEVLCVGNCLVYKEEQPAQLAHRYHSTLPLD